MSLFKRARLFIDQYGQQFTASTIKDLRLQIKMGGSSVGKMYVDKKDGSVKHIGYVIGGHWLQEFAPVEKVA